MFFTFFISFLKIYSERKSCSHQFDCLEVIADYCKLSCPES